MRISDWSSDVCSSDLIYREFIGLSALNALGLDETTASFFPLTFPLLFALRLTLRLEVWYEPAEVDIGSVESLGQGFVAAPRREHKIPMRSVVRSEEHTSELQSLMRISYAVFCLKKKNKIYGTNTTIQQT